MNYFGDIRLGETIDVKFTTVNVSGVPTQLAGTPVVSAYIGNDTTQLTAGITLTVDFDSVTGLNNVRVVATSGNGYATATNVILVITTGTVDSASVVGYVIGSFSIENRSAVMPTTAARTLDVSATGEAGIDWDNVGSPTATVGLTNTTVGVVTLLNGLDANVITATSIATDAITSSKVADGFLTAAKFASGAFDAVWTVTVRELTAFSSSFKTGYALSAAGIQAIWDALTAALTTAGSIGKLLVDNINATISSRATQTSVDDIYTDTQDIVTNGVFISTGGISAGSFAAGAIDAAALAASAGQEIADEILNRDIAGGGSGDSRNVRNALRAIRNKVDGSTGTLTVYEEDDTTPAWTAALTRSAVNNVVTVDP